MNKIGTIKQAVEIAQKLREQERSIVLVGGCFDILHQGHISFLHASAKLGDKLIVLLESDEKVRALKGKERPINAQKQRAAILATLETVSYIILLPYPFTNQDYDQLAIAIKPAIIATTAGDQHVRHKQRQAKLTGAQVVLATKRIKGKSTTTLVKHLRKDIQ